MFRSQSQKDCFFELLEGVWQINSDLVCLLMFNVLMRYCKHDNLHDSTFFFQIIGFSAGIPRFEGFTLDQ